MSAGDRINKLRRQLRRDGCGSLLVTNFVNVTYLTGFTGDDSYLLVTPQHAVLVTDARYTTQLAEECPDLELVVRSPATGMLSAVAELVSRLAIRQLGIESGTMTVGLHQGLLAALPKVQFEMTSGLVESLRIIKDRGEMAAIREAVTCAERAFAVVRAALHGDQTEKEVADDLEHQVRRFGGSGCSFPPIVAVGPRAALPHARPTQQHIGEHDFVLIDWGARKQGYMSDLTRVLITGKISPKFERVYQLVLKAQQRAIEAIRPGVLLCEVDKVARGIIDRAGHGGHFGHGLGHGIGLEIHEAPRLAGSQTEPLRPGMVVTVEPGIYLPGWGGVRIEDDVLVTRGGHEVLTSVPRDLEDCWVS